MRANLLMDKHDYVKRFTTLCLRSGLSDLPKDIRDQHILMKSIILTLEPTMSFTELEINKHIINWIDNVCQIKGLDQVTLRRRLIDTGYLIRSKDGSTYQVSADGPHNQYFDGSVDQLDIVALLDNARREIERKKSEYLRKSKKFG
jgi:hypothetical protein